MRRQGSQVSMRVARGSASWLSLPTGAPNNLGGTPGLCISTRPPHSGQKHLTGFFPALGMGSFSQEWEEISRCCMTKSLTHLLQGCLPREAFPEHPAYYTQVVYAFHATKGFFFQMQTENEGKGLEHKNLSSWHPDIHSETITFHLWGIRHGPQCE